MHLFLSLLILSLAAAASPLAFEENKGQTSAHVHYFVPRPSSNVLITAQGLRFVAPGHDVALSFPGASPLSWRASETQPGLTNYQKQRQQIQDVRHFSRLTAANVYPGIDLTLYFQGPHLEYDFIVHPQADPTQIRLQFSHPLNSNPQGAFTHEERLFRLHQAPPIVYQGTPANSIPSRWQPLSNNSYRFQPGPYNPKQTLILDPVLEFSSLLGGEAEEEIVAMGDGWVAGHTRSNYFPNSPGAPRAGRDIFLRFVPPIGTLPATAGTASYPLVHRTYIFGGSGDETLATAFTIASGSFMSATIVGTTSSADLPMQRPAGNQYRGGATGVFVVTILNNTSNPSAPNLTTYSGVYFGGSGEDKLASGFNTGAGYILAGTTDSPDLPVANPIQSELAGGKDAFLVYLPNGRPQDSLFVTYLGGEADDSVLDMQLGLSSILLAGESRSANWPLLPGERNGPSDAFLLTFNLYNPPTAGALPQPPDFRSALRIGGSGEDRITSLARSTSYLALGGETTSSDLTLNQAPQSTPGGASDAFYGLYNLATFENTLLSYYGGAGNETLRKVAINGDYDLVIAGSTTSADLPLHQALQSTLAGPSDAFFAYIGSSTRAIEVSSYLGGSGDDSIAVLHLMAPNSAPLRVAGSTTSPDFPLASPLPSLQSGASEAFWAGISLPILFAQESLWTAPKVTNSAFVYPQQASQPLTLTARIEDPSLAQIRIGGRRYSELTLPTAMDLPIEGLAESGETALLLSAPGYASRRVRIRLGRSVVTAQNFPAEISLFAGPIDLRATVQILDSTTNTLNSVGRALEFNELYPQWTSSDPNVAAIRNPSVGTYRLEALNVGQTTLNVDSPYAFWPEGGLPISVAAPRFSISSSPVYANPFVDPGLTLSVSGFTTPVDGYRIRGKFRIESEDPSLVQISVGSGNFSAALDLDHSAAPIRFLNLQIRALGSSGQTRIRISSPALAEDFYIPVQLSRLSVTPGIAVSQVTRSASVQLPPSSPFFLGVTLAYELAPTAVSPLTIPRLPLQLRVVSSNPQVVAPPADSLLLANVSSAIALRTEALAGVAELGFEPDSPHVVVAGTARVVSDPETPLNFNVAEIVVGHRLVASTTFASPSTQTVTGVIEALVEDPTLAGIALSASGAPAASQRITAGGSFGLWVHGLASSGSTTLRLRVAGRPDLRIPIKLHPSALAFTSEAISFAANTTLPSISLASYALDPNTLLPLLEQPIQPSQRVELSINSNSAELNVERPQCNFTASDLTPLSTQHCRTNLSWTKPGAYSLELSQPSGFTPPRGRTSLRVLVEAVRLNWFVQEVVGDCMLLSFVNMPNQNANPLRFSLTSLNPELMLFSSSTDSPPQARFEGLSSAAIYVHGLASQGLARFRIEGPDLVALERLVPLVPAQITFQDPLGSTAPTPLPLTTGTELRLFAHLASPSGQSIAGLRPGAPELPFTVQNSDPAIVSISPSTSSFITGITRRAVDVRALSAGDTSLSVESSLPSPAPFRIRVRQPGLASARFLIAKHTRVGVTLRLDSNSPAPTQDLLFTARSLNPSRLLLSSNQSQLGTSEITANWGARNNGTLLYLDALDSEGDSGFELKLPGYAPATFIVYFTSNSIGFASNRPPSQVQAGAEFNVEISLRPVIPPLAVGVPELTQFFGAPLYPGLDPSLREFKIEIADPNILSLISPTPPLLAGSVGFLRFRALRPGATTIRIVPPPGYATLPESETTARVTVTGSFIAVTCPKDIGNEGTVVCHLPDGAPSGLTIRSASAGRLMLTRPPLLDIYPQISFTPEQNPNYFHAIGLARSGTTDITLSAPGYVDTIVTFQHRDSAFVFRQALESPNGITAKVNLLTHVNIRLYAIGNDGRPIPGAIMGMRPGALPVTLTVTTQNPSLLQVQTPTFVINNPDQPGDLVLLKPLAPGNATITLSQPNFFAPPIPSTIAVRIDP